MCATNSNNPGGVVVESGLQEGSKRAYLPELLALGVVELRGEGPLAHAGAVLGSKGMDGCVCG